MNIEIDNWVSAGENALLFYLKQPIVPAYAQFFKALIQHLKQNHHDTFIEFVPSYNSCLLSFDVTAVKHRAVIQLVKSYIKDYQGPSDSDTTPHLIPVCYDEEFAPDLKKIAVTHHHPDTEAVIQCHTAKTYTVYSLGFIPGFAFLGHVDESIAMPRRATPRAAVAEGSVGIAGQQTGIYPKESPGGWKIIGRTPVTLYAPERNLFSRFEIGDQVRFQRISMDEYQRLKHEETYD